MYTATIFEKRSGHSTLDKYFKETSGFKCELVMKSQCNIVKDVNTIVNERLQTKWLDGQMKVRMC
jgi:hypothetical protein